MGSNPICYFLALSCGDVNNSMQLCWENEFLIILAELEADLLYRMKGRLL